MACPQIPTASSSTQRPQYTAQLRSPPSGSTLFALRPLSALSTSTTASIDDLLSRSISNSNFSLTGSVRSCSSSFSSARRPSAFSVADSEEERAEFGDECVSVLEPRPEMGWWSVSEVLRDSIIA
ncbi:hypothetical protein MMC25_007888 [Agyrium rufum]|nr:hypothetical protein [Agyrium rufum]